MRFKMKTMTLLIFKEEGRWVGQGIERDICVQADYLFDIYELFDTAVRLEAQEDGGIERIAPAPDRFKYMLEDVVNRYYMINHDSTYEYHCFLLERN